MIWKLFRYGLNTIEILFIYLAGAFLWLVNPAYRNVWLVLERGTDARDNGYFFFRYLREQHPEINAVYVITRDSPDYEKAASAGRVVEFMSFEHKVLHAIARAKISTHHNVNSPYAGHYRFADVLSSIPGVRISLQHGIIKDDMQYYHYPWLRLDMFCCAAKPEYEFIKHNFGHPDGVVTLTGLARYDNLLKEHAVKKQVLLMPTWRAYATNLSKEGFEASHLYQAYQSLITSNRLDGILEKYGYEMVFYPHYEIQKHIGSFSSGSGHIRIASMKDADVQQLLMESAVLVTDFSSVYFDFAYMGKPVLYYQFDEEEYRAGHYEQGYFNYRRDGFGPVLTDEDSLLAELECLLKAGCQTDGKYLSRADGFFGYRDQDNCNRIYKEICRRIKD